MKQHYSQFQVGDRVRASDSTPMPPKHHNKKLAKWKDRNFTGYVKEIEEPRDYQPNGGLVLGRDDYPDGSVMVFHFHHVLGGSIVFEKIPAGWDFAETDAA